MTVTVPLEGRVRSVEPGADKVRVTFWSSPSVYWLDPAQGALVERLRAAREAGEVVKATVDARSSELLSVG